jgi:hypothetical protein
MLEQVFELIKSIACLMAPTGRHADAPPSTRWGRWRLQARKPLIGARGRVRHLGARPPDRPNRAGAVTHPVSSVTLRVSEAVDVAGPK